MHFESPLKRSRSERSPFHLCVMLCQPPPPIGLVSASPSRISVWHLHATSAHARNTTHCPLVPCSVDRRPCDGVRTRRIMRRSRSNYSLGTPFVLSIDLRDQKKRVPPATTSETDCPCAHLIIQLQASIQTRVMPAHSAQKSKGTLLLSMTVSRRVERDCMTLKGPSARSVPPLPSASMHYSHGQK
jgi:hypothetical protein